ncbi:cardiolipin synthase [Sphingomonas sabuli]|uniref:Cardiolipin synthase n=1 Tax=Sphingomonas sabuli TaxID=2764186 RepID=A0A7G9L4R3_9SPHN|nr:cardiolipin synthase [Sphingomonas sabuli]QNM83612.1 cardiolipin synthase [Sphingomonas sabuli]
MQPLHILTTAVLFLAVAATLVRAILRPHREPAARLAWVLTIIAVPVIGVLAYLLVGEARVSIRRKERGREIDRCLPRPPGDSEAHRTLQGGPHYAPFALARSINDLNPVGGNSATLAADSVAAVDQMCADIDAARSTVHASFYIWLDDTSGMKIQRAFIRAARRGVQVRVIADALGSRAFIGTDHWQELCESGAQARRALPLRNVIETVIRGRVDLRNHRKSLIVDNRIAWVGSQNAADPEFRIKPHFAPWVDVMTRWEGPIARHCQLLFASDWMSEGGDDLSGLLEGPEPERTGDIVAQVIGTGPTLRFDAMQTAFAELIHAAEQELVVTTPYFVPDELLMYALTAAAQRGVRVVLILPKRIDSRIVAATCRSYFLELLEAGVEIQLYTRGLLHAKTMIADNRVGLVGSANLDRRSFELNFENNILFANAVFARTMRSRQDSYLADCVQVTADEMANRSPLDRLWCNFLAMMSPLL